MKFFVSFRPRPKAEIQQKVFLEKKKRSEFIHSVSNGEVEIVEVWEKPARKPEEKS